MRTSRSACAAALMLSACALFGVNLLAAQETVSGEPLDPATYGPSFIESMEDAAARDRLAPPAEGPRRERGVWMVPSRRATTNPRSGEHNVVNKWGDTRMGIGFPDVVDVAGAYFSGQSSEAVWTTGIRVIGYRDGQIVRQTDWFRDIGAEPAWFAMDLHGVTRIEIICEPVLDGAGWYAMDDLTYWFVTEAAEDAVEPIVVDFDDLGYDTNLTGSGYAGLIWEMGTGETTGGDAVHGPMIPPEVAARPTQEEQAPAQPFLGLGTAPALQMSFEGVIRGDANSWAYPPDTMGAIGPNHYVITVNRNFAVYDRTNGAELYNIRLDSFLPGSNGDPRCLFDQHSGRWVVIVCDFNTRIYLAFSLTDNPLGSWFKTSFVVSQGADAGRWPDYPTLGVDQHGIYTSAYMVGGPGHSIFAIDKAPLLGNPPTLGTVTAFRNLSWGGAIQPAHTYGSPPGEYLICVENSTSLRLRRVNPPLSSPTLTNLGTVSVASFGEPPRAQALGSSTPLDTVDSRPMMAVYRDGWLWTCHTIAAYSGTRAACRWYQIDPVAKTVIQHGTVQDPSMYYFFPGLMVNQNGNVAMGFTGSNAQMYASCYYTGRLASDPPGEMATPVLYKAGTGPQNNIDGYGRNRWGDYSYTTLDPVDNVTLWTIQEFGRNTDIWGTYVAVLSFGDGDCNGNGIPDYCDLDCYAAAECNVPGCGESSDCNANGIPDECEEDCNGNGVPDDCDIADGTSQDCNGNGIPDECDIAGGTSQDCNGNGIPDECDISNCPPGEPSCSDCNNNGIPDECDIASGTSEDCQPNGIPDECDLGPPPYVEAEDNCAAARIACPNTQYYGTTVGATVDGSASCGNSNSTPDVWYYYKTDGGGQLTVSLLGSAYDTVLSVHSGCPGTTENQLGCNDDFGGPQSRLQLVVNSNTVYYIRISGKDGATGDFLLTLTGPPCSFNAECNDNGIPDDCEPDCNGNGQPDDCDIAQGISQDLNGNGIPDECEGTVGDVNCDGVVDGFDIGPFVLALTDPAGYAAQYPDCNINNADINGDGAVDGFDIGPFVDLLTGN